LAFNISFACVFALAALFMDSIIQSMLAGPIHSARSLLATMPTEVVQSLPPLRMALRAVATEVQLLSKGRDASSFQRQLAEIVSNHSNAPKMQNESHP